MMTVGSGNTHYSKFSRPHDGVVVLGGIGKLHHRSSVDIQRVLTKETSYANSTETCLLWCLHSK